MPMGTLMLSGDRSGVRAHSYMSLFSLVCILDEQGNKIMLREDYVTLQE